MGSKAQYFEEKFEPKSISVEVSGQEATVKSEVSWNAHHWTFPAAKSHEIKAIYSHTRKVRRSPETGKSVVVLNHGDHISYVSLEGETGHRACRVGPILGSLTSTTVAEGTSPPDSSTTIRAVLKAHHPLVPPQVAPDSDGVGDRCVRDTRIVGNRSRKPGRRVRSASPGSVAASLRRRALCKDRAFGATAGRARCRGTRRSKPPAPPRSWNRTAQVEPRKRASPSRPECKQAQGPQQWRNTQLVRV